MKKELSSSEKAIRRERLRPIMMISVVLVIMVIVFEIVKPGFVSDTTHLITILKVADMLGCCCIGQTLLILQGGIDISNVAVIMFSTCIAAQTMNGENGNILKSVLVMILIGAIFGFLNGLFIHTLHIPAMVMTLSMGSVIQGIAYIMIKGAPKGISAPAFGNFVNGAYGGFINGAALFFAILSVITIIILKKTPFGRAVYSIGANPEAARYSGIHVGQITIISYMISSIMAAFCGMLFCGFTGQPFMTSGSTYDMDSIAAVVLGGTLITGGKGGFGGTIIGLFVYICLDSFMTMMSLPQGVKRVVQALLIIVMLLIVNKMQTKSKS